MKTRSQSLEIASAREFDLIVIGGGISGAGVAQDAACRGLSVLLLEKEDFSSGTSSRTTKLIHGGLRYLEQFHFKLTRELCQERELLEQLAPHMVREFSFILPLADNHPWFNLKASLGLTLYDILSWPGNQGHGHKRLGLQEVLQAAPALSAAGLKGGLKFHDCITDDSRLVLEVIKSATQQGAIAVNYIEVSGFDWKNKHHLAVHCHDRLNGVAVTFRGRACVNAAGVWSDQVCQMIDSNWTNQVIPSKGIHILVPPSAFETNTALFLPTADGRYVFVIPWQRALMIGTTDRAYQGKLEQPLPDQDEIDYLLQTVNGYARTKLSRSDIIGTFAGLRPLLQQGLTGPTANLSREHRVFEGPGGIIGVTGGKLTNYRIMAGQVVDKVFQKLPASVYKPSCTRYRMLGGWKDKQDFLSHTAVLSAKARKLSIEPAVLDHLIASYGADAKVIIDLIEKDASLNRRICPDFPPVMAEIPFCVHREMVVSLEDLLLRRLRLGILHQKQCLEAAPEVADFLAALLEWDETRRSLELATLEQSLREHLDVLRQPVA